MLHTKKFKGQCCESGVEVFKWGNTLKVRKLKKTTFNHLEATSVLSKSETPDFKNPDLQRKYDIIKKITNCESKKTLEE